MRLREWLLVALLSMAAGIFQAQSVKDGEKALRDAVLNQQLYLRGFAADDVVRWEWDGKTLVEQPPLAHMLGAFTATSVRVKKHSVEIRGDLRELIKEGDSTLKLSAGDDKMTIIAELHGADAAMLLPQLRSLLFYPNRETAIANLPSEYRSELPYTNAKQTQLIARHKQSCDCASACKASPSDREVVGISPPRVISAVDPGYSEEARRAGFNGKVQIGLDIDPSGHPKDLWITQSVGMGLDAQAARSVQQYVFAPAKCHGKPITVQLYIDVTFSIHQGY